MSESEISAARKELQKNERRSEEIDRLMAVNSKKVSELDAAMNLASAEFSKLTKLGAERSVIEADSQRLEEEWLALTEHAEKLRKALKAVGRL
jgi:chromosome segregation ATPase